MEISMFLAFAEKTGFWAKKKPQTAEEPNEDFSLISITYGNHQVTNNTVLEKFSHALKRGEPMWIDNNNLGGDPQPGVVKTCVIDYRVEKNGICLRRIADESTHINFNYHVSHVSWGGVALKDKPEVYERFHRAADEDKYIVINNQTMGFDPQVGTRKRCDLSLIYVDENREWERGFGVLMEHDKFPASSSGHAEEVPEIHYYKK